MHAWLQFENSLIHCFFPGVFNTQNNKGAKKVDSREQKETVFQNGKFNGLS